MGSFDRAYGARARQDRREQLYGTYLPLVKHLVGRLVIEFPEGISAELLEAGGLFGLIDAVAGFDPTREATFATEARERIVRGIHDTLRDWNPSPMARERQERVLQAYLGLPVPVELTALAAAVSLSLDELTETVIELRALDRLRDPTTPADFPFELSEISAAAWAKGTLDPALAFAFLSLETVPARLLTLYFREDLRLSEISEILRLPQVETKRIYRRALWGIGESLRQPK